MPLLIYQPEVLELYWCSGMQMSKWAGCLVEWIYCFPFTGSNLELLAEPEERHHEEKIGFEQMIQVTHLFYIISMFVFFCGFSLLCILGGLVGIIYFYFFVLLFTFFPVARREQVEIDGQVHIRSDPSCSYHSPEIRHDAVSST